MKDRIVYISFALVCLLTATLTYPTGGSGSRNSDKDVAASSGSALGFLFGGGPAPKKKDRALSESDFWKAGVSDKAIQDDAVAGRNKEGEPELLEPASAGNPNNPETGTPYSDAVMEQFSELRKMFPNNSIIPKRKSADEVKSEELERQNVFAAQTKIFQNTASKDEIDKFYDYQAKSVKDRLELLQYVLKEQGDQMSPDIKEKYNQILTMNQNQFQSFEEARKRAHATSKN